MEAAAAPGGSTLDWVTFGWRLVATFAFVFINGFFVAAEFALVKVQGARLATLVEQGSARARVATHIHAHMGRYLSACQLGITIASLILGWLAEPAVAELLLAGAVAAGWEFAPQDPILHGVALALALSIVTILHMTLGEQAPKLWAISRAENTSLQVAYPLRAFAEVFRPFIWLINGISNALLRSAGMSAEELSERESHSADELKWILSASAQAGHISPRQFELAGNILDIMELEVRHILVPRVDVIFLSLQNSIEENLRIMRESGHSRFPLCRVGLDSVIGIVHSKEVLSRLAAGETPDLRKLARRPPFVPDTQPLSRLIVQLQRTRTHACVVLDEHGTAVGLSFLEDALEEIVGEIRDEFDTHEEGVLRRPDGRVDVPGSMALPEAADLLGLREVGEEADTIGGHVVAELGRLPRKGDRLEIGPYAVTITGVSRRRIERLEFRPLDAEPEATPPPAAE